MAINVSHPHLDPSSNPPTPTYPLLEFQVFSGSGMIQFEKSKTLGLNGCEHLHLRQNVDHCNTFRSNRFLNPLGAGPQKTDQHRTIEWVSDIIFSS